MQVHTERGLINVEAEYQSEEKAKMDGYSYAFYSNELEKKVYSKCLDDRGLYHTFALIVGYNQNNYFKGGIKMGKYHYNADGKSKEEIMDEFVRICKVGTSRDCRIVVNEAKRHGISYEELCEYKRNLGIQK